MTNEGTTDRIIRVVLGVALIAVAWLVLGLGALPGILAGIVGLVLLVTGAVGVCPAYCVLNVRTCPVKPRAS
jgi:hypothetical protein